VAVSHARGVGSALDVVLFLLLVAVAVGSLTLPVPPERPPDAAGSVARLDAVTASVEYSLSPGVRQAETGLVTFDRGSGPEFRRHAGGSLASLVAEAAVANLTVAGREPDHADDGFGRAVAAAVRNRTGPRVRVRATWRPYPGAPVGGRFGAGRAPTPDARVATVTRTIDSGYPDIRGRAITAAERDGWTGVARVVAGAVVRGTFPPDRSRVGLRADYPVDALLRYRYRRVAAAVGTDIEGPLAGARTHEANARLRRALAARLETDLRRSFDSPAAAARAVQVGEVRLAVRRWEPRDR
jgi:hypothetical protein